jgi:hypothetical protein
MASYAPDNAKRQRSGPPDEIILEDIWVEGKKLPKPRHHDVTAPDSMLDNDQLPEV